MKFNSLDAWLNWQASLNPVEIDLGLERIADVLQRLGLSRQFECPLIMVAGTNGKGSVVAMLEAFATAAGVRVCSYTSPHITRYNERIRINGKEIDDASLCESFERIDQARGEEPLTYFEFGTLAAIDLFKRAQPDLVIMEVGLGGRLDAVNIMEPDVSVITSIAIDHTDWLGETREAIAIEKAGILRENKPTICGDAEPPVTLLDIAQQKSVELFRLGESFSVEQYPNEQEQWWGLRSPFGSIQDLPVPSLKGDFQKGNAATAIMALQVLGSKLEISADNIRQGLGATQLKGRFEILRQRPLVIADVAHNPHAIASLVTQLQAQPIAGKTYFVMAMLADKPVSEAVKLLLPVADGWYTAGLEDEPRGLSAKEMSSMVKSTLLAHNGADVKLCPESTVEAAITAAMGIAEAQDRIVILGSFYTVAAATHYFS
jgi:dihydrofolate synthase/folylpolyglutamate synthase